MDSGSNPVRGSASINLHRLDDLRNRLSTKDTVELAHRVDYGSATTGTHQGERLPDSHVLEVRARCYVDGVIGPRS
jgi:hypothetical protein